MTQTRSPGARWARAAVAVAVGGLLLAGYVKFVPYGLAWNLTDSISRGLYFSEVLAPDAAISRGDLVCLQYVAPAWASQRQYGAPKLRMCKPIVALPGDVIERSADVLRVLPFSGAAMEIRLLPTDSKGRPLPQDSNPPGAVPPDTVFLISTHSPRSLDSRYLGPSPRLALTHRVYPLWLLD